MEEYSRKVETDLIIESSGKGPGHSTPRNDFPGPSGERILYSTTVSLPSTRDRDPRYPSPFSLGHRLKARGEGCDA